MLEPATTVELADGPAVVPAERVRRAAILSVATELPDGRLTNAELASRLGLSEEWIVSRTGIRERRRAAPEERLTDFATAAGAAALARAGVPAETLDLVIVGTMTPDELTPNTAPLVADALGATRAGAFDVGAACTAFLSGLAIASGQIEAHRADTVLLIGADFVTRITDYDDKRSAPLFADAAGAVVLGPAGPADGAVGPIVLGADGSHAATISATHERRKLEMDGPEVYRNAVARMSEVTVQAVARAGLTLEQIDLFVYHQANARITRALGERLGLPPARVVDCIETLGNASAATLPVALDVAERDGRLKPGSRVLVSAFGAGFTWGGGVIEWGGSADA
ncbi:MAG TPA: beta-ketoacyl-ACP synthase 3 [Solirubrobacteraceae bacterium]|jgi:3-oxoacyl-[acyl-carrier-protein] synthase-3|nr:beta-ketoacyl-ACP synthase 3 [Solirubrobacteraceae bacterium]